MGVSCNADCVVCKIGVVSKQNVTNHVWCSINWTAGYQSAMISAKSKMLTVLDMPLMQSFRL